MDWEKYRIKDKKSEKKVVKTTGFNWEKYRIDNKRNDIKKEDAFEKHERDVSIELKNKIRGGTFAETQKEVDHKLSLFLGGDNAPENLQALKNSKTLKQAAYDLFTGNERQATDYAVRQEGKYDIEKRVLQLWNEKKISLENARNAVLNWNNSDLVKFYTGEDIKRSKTILSEGYDKNKKFNEQFEKIKEKAKNEEQVGWWEKAKNDILTAAKGTIFGGIGAIATTAPEIYEKAKKLLPEKKAMRFELGEGLEEGETVLKPYIFKETTDILSKLSEKEQEKIKYSIDKPISLSQKAKQELMLAQAKEEYPYLKLNKIIPSSKQIDRTAENLAGVFSSTFGLANDIYNLADTIDKERKKYISFSPDEKISDELGKIIDKISIKALSTESGKKYSESFAKYVAKTTEDIPMKLLFQFERLGVKTYKELVEELENDKKNPENSYTKNFLYEVQNASGNIVFSMALLLGLGKINKKLGVGASSAYWAALSANEQIEEKGKIYSGKNILIDTVGDSLIGNVLSGVFGGKKSISATTKAFKVEGGTEVVQTILKASNDYQKAQNDEEKEKIINEMNYYVRSGAMLTEFLVGGLSAGGVSILMSAPSSKITKEQLLELKDDSLKIYYSILKLQEQPPSIEKTETVALLKKQQERINEVIETAEVVEKKQEKLKSESVYIKELNELKISQKKPTNKHIEKIVKLAIAEGKTKEQIKTDIQKTTINNKMINEAFKNIEIKEKTVIKKVSREKLPVKTLSKETKTKISKLEARMKGFLNNVEQDVIEKFGLSTYETMNKPKQTRMAAEYVAKNKEEAIDVLLGKKQAPKGLLNNSIYLALLNEADTSFDYDLALKVASLSATRMGQEISMLSEANEFSATNAVNNLIKIYEKGIQKRTGKTVKQFVSNKINKEAKKVKEQKPTKNDWLDFVEEIKCK